MLDDHSLLVVLAIIAIAALSIVAACRCVHNSSIRSARYMRIEQHEDDAASPREYNAFQGLVRIRNW